MPVSSASSSSSSPNTRLLRTPRALLLPPVPAPLLRAGLALTWRRCSRVIVKIAWERLDLWPREEAGRQAGRQAQAVSVSVQKG